MSADDRAHGAVDDGHVGAARLAADLLGQPARVLLGVRGHDGQGQLVVPALGAEVVGLEVGQDRAQGLLAAAAHAAQREGAVGVVGELGLDVELAAHRGRGGRDAAAAREGVEGVQREVAVDVVARLLGPGHELLGGEALGRLVHGLEGEQLGRRRRADVVHDVDLEVGVALAHHLGRLAGGVDARGEAAREGQVDRRRALLGRALKDLEVVARGDGRGGGRLARAHAVVELLGGHGLPEVVDVLLPAHDVGEAHDLDAERLGDAGGEVGAGVDDDPHVGRAMIRAAQARSLLRRLGVGV